MRPHTLLVLLAVMSVAAGTFTVPARASGVFDGRAPVSAQVLASALDVALSMPALGEAVELPKFQLTSTFLDVAPRVAAASPSIVVPPRYGWILDDGKAFWFAAGASSVVTLGTHILVGLPTLFFGAVAAANAGQASPPSAVPLLLGIGGAYMLGQAALASLTSFLVFNAVSRVYDGNWLVSFAAHIGGTLLGVGVSALPFGMGFMLIGGLNGLGEFTGGAGLSAVGVLSLLGALPAVVVGGIALIGVPALIGSWAMAVSATPKEGYSVQPLAAPPVVALPPTSRASEIVPVPMVAIAIPGT